MINEQKACPKNFNELIKNYKVQIINEALSRNNNNQSKAAKEIGLDRSTLRRLISN
ncbi:MAG: hypothetical protein KDD56_00950 [Bdellovibrionales bacterium]|nr:hypothetical protein [Bdellovibrionales bacterium]